MNEAQSLIHSVKGLASILANYSPMRELRWQDRSCVRLFQSILIKHYPESKILVTCDHLGIDAMILPDNLTHQQERELIKELEANGFNQVDRPYHQN